MSSSTFDKLQQIEIDQNKPLRERYIQMLISDARGEEVSLDELGTLRAELGVDEAKLRRHFEAARQFIEGERLIARGVERRAEYDELSQKLDRLKEEKRKFMDKWLPKFEPAQKRHFELGMKSGDDIRGRSHQKAAMEILLQ